MCGWLAAVGWAEEGRRIKKEMGEERGKVRLYGTGEKMDNPSAAFSLLMIVKAGGLGCAAPAGGEYGGGGRNRTGRDTHPTDPSSEDFFSSSLFSPPPILSNKNPVEPNPNQPISPKPPLSPSFRKSSPRVPTPL